MEKLYQLLKDRKEQMERGIFTHPPSNWDEYQKRLGRWAELAELILIIEGKQQEQENG
jgi:hypothetical protein